MNLNLKKPLVFLDIEATGLHHTKDRIVEVGLLRLQPDGTEEKKVWRVNPEIPIPDKISEIIGISNEDVKDKPLFKSAGGEILNFIGSADLAGYNPFRLDLPMLMEEFMRAGYDFDISRRKVIDVQRIFFMFEKRDLHAAYLFYCGKNLNGHHGAMADTEATSEILHAQLKRYTDLGSEVSQICEATGNPVENIVDIVGRIVRDEKGEEIFNFGKYKGEKVADVLRRDPSYYTWMMNGDFTAYTKKKLTEIRLRMKSSS
jgi:DNA polymerase-3 subunit epsilon